MGPKCAPRRQDASEEPGAPKPKRAPKRQDAAEARIPPPSPAVRHLCEELVPGAKTVQSTVPTLPPRSPMVRPREKPSDPRMPPPSPVAGKAAYDFGQPAGAVETTEAHVLETPKDSML